MTIIGIDLGTTTGWAILDDHGNRIDSGYWHLPAGERKPAHLRFEKLSGGVHSLILTAYAHARDRGGNVDVAYERPTFFGHLAPALVFGGFEAVLLVACAQDHIPYHPIPVSHVKLAAIGRGRAKRVPGVLFDPKAGMQEAAAARWSLEGLPQLDECDALWTAEACRVALQAGTLPWEHVPPTTEDVRRVAGRSRRLVTPVQKEAPL